MMNVLIVAATKFEIEPFVQQKKNEDILISGVGIPSTMYHLTKKLLEKEYDLVVQAGIAGTFNNNFSLGDVMVIKDDSFSDIGIEEKGSFQTLFEKGFIDKNEFPFVDGTLPNHSKIIENLTLPMAIAITVNKISDATVQNRILNEKLTAGIESMEGAAFHYVCLQEKINFLQLRSLSNMVGERDKSKWKLKASIENLNKELIKIIDNL